MPTPTALELFTPFFGDLTDPRVARGRHHNLLDIVVLAVCATLGNANTFADVERFARAKLDLFKTFLELPHGVPSHDTFSRVFARIDPAALLECVRRWLDALGTAVAGEVVAIDGKTLKGSFDAAAGQSPLHLVSAWACDARLCLGQVAVDQKSNEITAIPVLLKLLDLTGATVTIDAIGCQTEIASAIRARGADYVLAVKDNQPGLHQLIAGEFVAHAEAGFADPRLKRLTAVERNRGRGERREYMVAPAPKAVTVRWKDAKSIGMVTRTRAVGGVESDELSYYVSSRRPRVKAFARAVRGHWGIENRLHWTLDVTFTEDASRVRRDNGPMNLATLRRLALSLLQQDRSLKDSIRGKRLRAGWDDEALLTILTGFTGD
jgi:predicted transposase YbfD/YdcC